VLNPPLNHFLPFRTFRVVKNNNHVLPIFLLDGVSSLGEYERLCVRVQQKDILYDFKYGTF